LEEIVDCHFGCEVLRLDHTEVREVVALILRGLCAVLVLYFLHGSTHGIKLMKLSNFYTFLFEENRDPPCQKQPDYYYLLDNCESAKEESF
jgi:hypothetical protein